MFRAFWKTAILALALGGCAIGNTYDYNLATPLLQVQTTRSISVAVSDQRPYVVAGGKAPSFVGLQRGGFGNPFDVTTVSGRPLAADLADLLARSLAQKGARTTAIIVPPGARPSDADFDTERLLFVAIREWKSDVYANVTMHWNLEAVVLDRSGTELARNAVSGTGPAGTGGFQSSNASTAVAAASQHLAALLNDAEIVAALR